MGWRRAASCISTPHSLSAGRSIGRLVNLSAHVNLHTKKVCVTLSPTSGLWWPGKQGCEMKAAGSANCQRPGCAKAAPSALASAQLCLDHFLDEAFLRTDQALTRCREGSALTKDSLEWLLADALATVKNLEESADEPQPEQRDRMLELLLILANLHEYVAHHSVHVERPA